ncbi:MAG: leucyl/phenylalanyl-tRNA--protein transferase [Rhodobacteraceae bacterium]|nr:leucyl/phenylalanyl-tRNA--protein transferase [Paracoccaceae bacterium]
MTVTPEILLQAYCSGVFPMAEHRNDPEIFWVDPKRRGVFPIDGFHVSRSLAKRLRRGDCRATLNHDFGRVVQACAQRPETWISREIFDLYSALHSMGYAHSLEVWRGDDLAGGIYGVAIGGAFFGESMFSHQTDGSKLALAWLIDLLKRTGFSLFDTQFLTDHLASLGAVEISRASYHAQLATALSVSADITAHPVAASGHEVVHRSTQIS